MARQRPRTLEARGEPDEPAAMEIAARYLGTRPRTRWEIERRLRRAGTTDAVVEAAIGRLVTLGYVDDASFARWWGDQRDRHGPRGRRMIEAELRQRGVPRDVIEAYREEHASPERTPEDASLPATEGDRARDALERHLRGRPLPADRAGMQRLGMFLVRRGFDPDIVRSTLRNAGTDDPDNVG